MVSVWSAISQRCCIRHGLWAAILSSAVAESQPWTGPILTSTIFISTLSPTTQGFTSVVTASGTTPGESATLVTIVVTLTEDATSIPTPNEIASRTYASGGASSSETLPVASDSGSVDTVGASGAPQSTASTSQSDHSLPVAAAAAVSVCITLGVVVLGFSFGWFLIRRKKLRALHRIPEEDLAQDGGPDANLPAEKNGTPVSEICSPVKLHEGDGCVISELQSPLAELEGDEPEQISMAKAR